MPRGPRKLAIEFGATGLTHYGGVYLLHRFLSRVGFKDAIAREIRLAQRNNRYSVGEMLLALLYPMLLGLDRIDTTQLLRQNGVFQYLTGLPSYPDATTLRRFLLRVAPIALPKLRALHDRFLHRMTLLLEPPARVIFDVDSTVLVVYGKQEQARIGYNPVKRGRPSYHPLLCFEGHSRDFWHGELRPGDAHTAAGILDLLTACFAKIPAGVRSVIVRADKGFYDHGLVEWLEAGKASFVVVARLTGPIKRRLAHLRYTSPSRGVEVAEFRYQPTRWRRSCRDVVIRQLKGDYALGHIPGHHFLANETYFHLMLLAYNLTNWFKRLCLPPQFQNATLQTLRQKILLMPAQLVRTGNRSRLNLPASGQSEAAWLHALRNIERLRV